MQNTLHNPFGENLRDDPVLAPTLTFPACSTNLESLNRKDNLTISEITENHFLLFSRLRELMIELISNSQKLASGGLMDEKQKTNDSEMRALLPSTIDNMHSLIMKMAFGDKLVIISNVDKSFVSRTGFMKPTLQTGIRLVDMLIKMYTENLISPSIDMELISIIPGIIKLDNLVIGDLKRIYERLKRNVYDQVQVMIILSNLQKFGIKLHEETNDDSLLEIFALVEEETQGLGGGKKMVQKTIACLEYVFKLNNYNYLPEEKPES